MSVGSPWTLKSIHSLLTVLLLVVSFNGKLVANGALENLTAKEIQALEKFRPLVADALYRDYMKSDSYLLRWLRYYNFDINRVANLVKTAHKWRRDNKIDSILDEDFSAFEKVLTYEMDGIAKDGRPIWNLPFGKWDVRKYALAGRINEYNRYLDYLYEKIETRVRELDEKNPDKNITQFLLVIDMQGYNLRQHGCIACIPGNVHFIQVYERYYSGSAYKSILINTPAIFEQLYEILKPFMSAVSVSNLGVYGFNQNEWFNELNKYISKDQLPVKLGGTKRSKTVN